MIQFGVGIGALERVLKLVCTGEPKRLRVDQVHESGEIHVAPENGVVGGSNQFRVRFKRHLRILRRVPQVSILRPGIHSTSPAPATCNRTPSCSCKQAMNIEQIRRRAIQPIAGCPIHRSFAMGGRPRSLRHYLQPYPFMLLQAGDDVEQVCSG